MNRRSFSNTNWNLYRSFIVVYEVGSYTKAEHVLHLARNNVKANIETLSKQLGVKLFIPHTKGMTPTQEAVELYNNIEPLISAIGFAEKNVGNLEDSRTVIRMIFPLTLAGSILGEFFINYKKQYKNVDFEFYYRGHQESYDLFLRRKIDIVIDVEETCKDYNLDIQKLLNLKLAFVSTNKFLNERNLSRKINIDELSTLPLICHRTHINAVNSENNLNLMPFITSSTLEPVLPFVELGSGVCLHHMAIVNKLKRTDDIVALNVDGITCMPSFKLVCGYRKENVSKAVATFIDALVDFCSKNYCE